MLSIPSRVLFLPSRTCACCASLRNPQARKESLIRWTFVYSGRGLATRRGKATTASEPALGRRREPEVAKTGHLMAECPGIMFPYSGSRLGEQIATCGSPL